MLQKLLIISTLFHLELDTRWFSFFIALNNFLTKFPYVILQKFPDCFQKITNLGITTKLNVLKLIGKQVTLKLSHLAPSITQC